MESGSRRRKVVLGANSKQRATSQPSSIRRSLIRTMRSTATGELVCCILFPLVFFAVCGLPVTIANAVGTSVAIVVLVHGARPAETTRVTGEAFAPDCDGSPGLPNRVLAPTEHQISHRADRLHEAHQSPSSLGTTHQRCRSSCQINQGHRSQCDLYRRRNDDRSASSSTQLFPPWTSLHRLDLSDGDATSQAPLVGPIRRERKRAGGTPHTTICSSRRKWSLGPRTSGSIEWNSRCRALTWTALTAGIQRSATSPRSSPPTGEAGKVGDSPGVR